MKDRRLNVLVEYLITNGWYGPLSITQYNKIWNKDLDSGLEISDMLGIVKKNWNKLDKRG